MRYVLFRSFSNDFDLYSASVLSRDSKILVLLFIH